MTIGRQTMPSTPVPGQPITDGRMRVIQDRLVSDITGDNEFISVERAGTSYAVKWVGPQFPAFWFAAEITGESSSEAGAYSWKRIAPATTSNPTNQYVDDYLGRTGTETARSLGEEAGISTGTRVWMRETYRGAGGARRFEFVLAQSTIPLRITNQTSITTNRWGYDAVQVRVDDAATSADEDVTGGLSITYASGDLLLNRLELNNTGSGIEGNGVNVDNLNSGFSLQPIAVGAVVEAKLMASGVWWFTATNAIDGTCA